MTRLVARFSGLQERAAPLTWGQMTQQVVLDFAGEEAGRQNIDFSMPVPNTSSVDSIVAVVTTLLTRHEGLRSLYVSTTRGAEQRVQADGSLAITVVQRDRKYDADVALRENAHLFHHERELPVKAFLDVLPDGSRQLRCVASHLVIDNAAVQILRREVRELFAEGGQPRAESPTRQPVDRAIFESSDAGRAISRRNLDRWTRFMSEEASRRSPLVQMPAKPRFWFASLQSPGLGRSVRSVAERTGATPATLFLAAMSAALTDELDVASLQARVAFHNRIRPDDQGVEPLMQWGLAVVDAASRSPEKLIVTSRSAAFKAYRTARYDTNELFAERNKLKRDGHSDPLTQVIFQHEEVGETGVGQPWAVPMAPDPYGFFAAPSHERDSAGLFITSTRSSPLGASISFLFDTRLFATDDVRRVALTMERWIHALA